MFQKYSRFCCTERDRVPIPNTFTASCCPYRPPLFNAAGQPLEYRESIPESVRLRQQLCVPYIRPGPASSTCLPGGAEGGANSNPVANLGSPGLSLDAPVPVRTFSASEYTALLGAQVLNAASNAANPDTRFQQYFPELPPAPIGIICPERLPNPVATRDTVCVPQGLFAPSVEGGPIA